MIRCTYHDWRRNSHTGDKQCNQTATIFYKLKENALADFQSGSEGEKYGGYLARCSSHEPPTYDRFEVIDAYEYIVGSVMET